jgi:C4-type Zn-finger protein
MAVDEFAVGALEASTLDDSMETLAIVLNRKVECQIKQCLTWLLCAREELQDEEIPTIHMASTPAKHAVGMIQDVEDGLHEVIEKLETHPEIEVQVGQS